MTQKIFLNNALVDLDQACISVTDGGLLHGIGLFETMRAQNGIIFAQDDHINRLLASAVSLGIACTYEPAQIADAINSTIKANNLSVARVRATLTSGPVLQDGQEPQPTLLITASAFEPYPANYYQTGAAVILSEYRQNSHDPLTGHKTINYFSRLLALNIARQKMAVEALWFTTDNRLAEGSVSNVFLVRDDKLFTPPLNTPVLPGIIRKHVCKIAAALSIEVVEDDLFISDVLSAQEIFITSSIMHILPVVKVESHTVGTGKVGPVAAKLSQALDEAFNTVCK